MSTIFKVYSADPLVLAEQRRHHTIRTALAHIVAGEPSTALELLRKSVERCARLDHRPLDPARVMQRYEAMLRTLGGS
jgi:hypothetical protein